MVTWVVVVGCDLRGSGEAAGAGDGVQAGRGGERKKGALSHERLEDVTRQRMMLDRREEDDPDYKATQVKLPNARSSAGRKVKH